MPVYFVQIVADNGPIKIGHSKHAAARAHHMKIWMPWDLRLLGTVPGDTRSEAFIQNRFAHCHIRGEWFNPAPDLLAYIADCVDRQTIIGEPSTRAPGPRHGVRGQPWTHRGPGDGNFDPSVTP